MAHVVVLLLGLLLLFLLLGRSLGGSCRSSSTSRSSSTTATHAGKLGETSGDQLLSGLALAGCHNLAQSLFVGFNSNGGEDLLHVGGGHLVPAPRGRQSR